MSIFPSHFHLPQHDTTPISLRSMFAQSSQHLKNPRSLVVIALFLALNLALDMLGFKVYVTPTVRLSFGFLCNASIGMLFGPVAAMIMGCATDLLSFLLSDASGMAFFPGYTITAMVNGVFAGLWLYPNRPSVRRVVGTRACVCLFSNILLNTFWASILYGESMIVLLPARILKNLILLPFEVIMLYAVANIVLRQYYRVFRTQQPL